MLSLACSSARSFNFGLFLFANGSRTCLAASTYVPLLLAAARRSLVSAFSLHVLTFAEAFSQSPHLRALLAVSAVIRYVSLSCDSLSTVSPVLSSAELLWPALRWQERECADMLGVFFVNKRDRRSLFLPSLIGLSPLRRSTPTSGFFELSSAPAVGLVLRRLGSA
jgi:hypothetical protein